MPGGKEERPAETGDPRAVQQYLGKRCGIISLCEFLKSSRATENCSGRIYAITKETSPRSASKQSKDFSSLLPLLIWKTGARTPAKASVGELYGRQKGSPEKEEIIMGKKDRSRKRDENFVLFKGQWITWKLFIKIS